MTSETHGVSNRLERSKRQCDNHRDGDDGARAFPFAETSPGGIIDTASVAS